MAVLKQKEEKKIRMVKKEVTLTQDMWSSITSYIKFAEIKGSQVDKRNFVINGALSILFDNDKGFQEYLAKVESENTAKVETKEETKKEEQKKVEEVIPPSIKHMQQQQIKK